MTVPPDPGYRTSTDDELRDHDERVARAKGWYWGELAAPAGELCGCRCKNPKGRCGCCDEALLDWYASSEDEDTGGSGG